MYADRASRGRMSPAGLTLAVGINAALIAALIWSAPELPKVINWDPIDVTNVPLDPPPPPNPDIQPKKRLSTPQPIDLAMPQPKVPTPARPIDLTGTIDPPPIPLDGLAGSGIEAGGGVTVDPPKPAPVMVDAATDPRYAADLQPEYPAAMRRAGKEGQVVVKVLIGADGRVKDIQLVSSPDPAFFEATRRQALSRWRFKPATRDGIPYESWKTMRLGFRLTDA